MNREWNNRFGDAQSKIYGTPLLAFLRSQGSYTVDTHSYDMKTECVLLQNQLDGSGRPIVYWSCSLNGARHPYDMMPCKWFSVLWEVLLFSLYVEDSRFTVRTDHDVLHWILNLTDSTWKIAQWGLRLSEFEFDVVHCAGMNHLAADALFRQMTIRTDRTPIEYKIPLFCITVSIPFRLRRRGKRYVCANYDELYDNKGIGIPALHFIATSADSKHEKRLITAQ